MQKKSTAKYRTTNNQIRTGIRHLGVMIEHVDDKVSAIAEQYKDIKDTLSSQSKTLKNHSEMIADLKVDTTQIKEELKQKADKKDVELLRTKIYSSST